MAHAAAKLSELQNCASTLSNLVLQRDFASSDATFVMAKGGWVCLLWNFGGYRPLVSSNEFALKGGFLDRVRSARADWYRAARIAASPHLEMPPFLSVSPEAYFFGVRPR